MGCSFYQLSSLIPDGSELQKHEVNEASPCYKEN
jgi:hypothetical protein